MSIQVTIIILSIAVYVIVGLVVGRRIKNTTDYYVSGRRMPTFLIVGTLAASLISTNGFMGETGWSYTGNFVNEMVINFFCCAGLGFGVIFFGRYLRRSESLTMPEYFGNRFASRRMQRLAGIITLISITCYLLAVTTGVGVLLSELTGLDLIWCYLISFVCFVSFTFYSGSNGVIITDTIMFCVFLGGVLISMPYMFKHGGGFGNLITALMGNPEAPEDLLAYHGNLAGAGAVDPFGAVVYTVIYSLVWFIVTGISPWQAGRYLMAKTEHVAIRAGVIGAIVTSVFFLFLHLQTISLINWDAGLEPERALVAGYAQLAPAIVGSIALAGIMAAGLSSASTFLSIIGFSITNDIFDIKFRDDKHKLFVSRIIVLVFGIVAFGLACADLGGIRIVAWLASTLIASTWCVVAFASVWSKKLTERGAFLSMLVGFIGFVVTKVLYGLGVVSIFYNLLDPFFIGIYLSLIFAIIGSAGQKHSELEQAFFEKMHVTPKSELVLKDIRVTKISVWICILGGIAVVAFLVVYWAAPYNGWM
ncbi:MAG: sodium:solute symporter family protein [Clostridiales Family XIII bacterium]|jgi:sodium/pantothenate symporter|nr:sodium:solute symporter family protein [Clostridiales Family XIII bacterium]